MKASRPSAERASGRATRARPRLRRHAYLRDVPRRRTPITLGSAWRAGRRFSRRSPARPDGSSRSSSATWRNPPRSPRGWTPSHSARSSRGTSKRCATCLERHGGSVEKFIGDAVMAVFGVPTMHEDDALRAVRAAMEMHDALEVLNDELERDWGVRLRHRIGVNSGEVVAGDAFGGQTFVTGEPVNVASRLGERRRSGRHPARRGYLPAGAGRGQDRGGRALRAEGTG